MTNSPDNPPNNSPKEARQLLELLRRTEKERKKVFSILGETPRDKELEDFALLISLLKDTRASVRHAVSSESLGYMMMQLIDDTPFGEPLEPKLEDFPVAAWPITKNQS